MEELISDIMYLLPDEGSNEGINLEELWNKIKDAGTTYSRSDFDSAIVELLNVPARISVLNDIVYRCPKDAYKIAPNMNPFMRKK